LQAIKKLWQKDNEIETDSDDNSLTDVEYEGDEVSHLSFHSTRPTVAHNSLLTAVVSQWCFHSSLLTAVV
jgi:hypothetical protein